MVLGCKARGMRTPAVRIRCQIHRVIELNVFTSLLVTPILSGLVAAGPGRSGEERLRL